MTIDEFINKTKGKEYDVDGAYNVQCVDGIAEFTILMSGSHNFTTGTGWAEGLWTKYGSNGVEKYFNKHSLSSARKGDWVVWKKGSKYAPNSHVGMFIKWNGNLINTYGQSQNGIKAFNFANLSKDGVLGVLRLKTLETARNEGNTARSSNSFFDNGKGWFGYGDSSTNIGKIAEFMYQNFPAYTNKKALGNYYGKYIRASITEFQKRTGLEADGNVGPKTLLMLEKYGFRY